MRRAPLLFLMTLALVGCRKEVPVHTDFEVHYSPSENLEQIDTNLIAQAHHSIDLAAYSLTDYAVADALVAAAGRGVAIRIYRDKVQSEGEAARAEKTSRRRKANTDDEDEDNTSGVLQRLATTPNIQVRIKHSRTLMHLKAYSVDGGLLRTGSANFSPTGEKRQDNDLVITHDETGVRRFEADFITAWNRVDNESVQP